MTASGTGWYDPEPENIYDRPVDKKKGKSAAFKSVTRKEIDRIAGPRPLYAVDFMNEPERYKVKFQDPKLHGRVSLNQQGPATRNPHGDLEPKLIPLRKSQDWSH